ncbi:MAG: hypothetical protein WC631_03065 [Candidatus Paceibacterota bacterium]|jgi:hypothetical protein
MKSISNILNRGNLTPRERYILLIQNDIHRSKTGKDILTPADKEALENWKAQNNTEANEWNNLNEAWKHSGRVEIEAEFVYKDAQVSYMAQLPFILKLLDYPLFQRMDKSIKMLKDIKRVTINGALEIVAKQKATKLKSGLDFDYAVYQLAFEMLNEDDRKRMNKLYSDIEFDHQYLDQEEIIAVLFDGKDTLDQKAKEKLASLVAEHSYNGFAKEYQLFHYFACIPILEIARYFLTSKGIVVKGPASSKNQEADEQSENICERVTKTMGEYSKQHGISMEDMLKEACLRWIDNGLFDKYRPLAISNDVELLKRWLARRTEAKNLLLGYIKDGVLRLQEESKEENRLTRLCSKNLCDSELKNIRKFMKNVGEEIIEKTEEEERLAFEKFTNPVITGESLYACKKDYKFVRKFKERVEEYEPNLGIVYNDNDPEQVKDHLDRELLICSLNKDGKPTFFSIYEMSVSILSGLANGMNMFEEETIKGKKFLKFESELYKSVFRERCQNLIDGYSKLLAFEGILKKLSKIFEVDLMYHLSDRIKMLRTYLEEINKAICRATNTDAEDSQPDKFDILKRDDKLIFKDFELIDIDSIKPDIKSVEEHEQKFKKILGEF